MLFVLRTKHAVDGVRRPVTGFMVVAHLHLAQQSDGKKIQSAKQQAESEHHQRAVGGHNRDVAQKLLQPKPRNDSAAAEQADQPEGSEKVQGRER